MGVRICSRYGLVSRPAMAPTGKGGQETSDFVEEPATPEYQELM
jgi:hypothetical protein